MQISEISKITGLPISTLRYYDKHGLIPNLSKSASGTRKFTAQDLNTLRMINCLKTSGMKISEIKQFMEWCIKGDTTLNKRLNMFYEQETNIHNQIAKLNKVLKLIKFKEWYYEKALQDGTEALVKNITLEEMPPNIVKLYKETHKKYEKQ